MDTQVEVQTRIRIRLTCEHPLLDSIDSVSWGVMLTLFIVKPSQTYAYVCKILENDLNQLLL